MKLLIYLGSLMFVSCLDFGDDVELVGAEITRKEINYVSELTGLTFPNDTEPVGYYFAQEQKWWKVDELTYRIDGALELLGQKLVECTLGRENNRLHIYVTWFEI